MALGNAEKVSAAAPAWVNYWAMKQQTLAMAADAQLGFEQHRKPTRRDEFLKTMDSLVPWAALCEEIAPHYPKAGNGRPPIGLQRMLRIHFIQHWFNLADLSWRVSKPSTTVPVCVASSALLGL